MHALEDKKVEEVFALYSPTQTVSTERDADCQWLHEADAIVCNLPEIKASQPVRLDPLGDIPIWLQLWNTFHPRQEAPALPWLLPKREAELRVSELLTREVAGWREGNRLLILSPFSGSPKKAVEDAWWREFISVRSDSFAVAPVYGCGELEKARLLFDGTSVRVIEADLDQTIALGALPNSEVIGVDGGRLNLLAASRKDSVSAFYGIWPASAWALPNVRTLSPGSPGIHR